MRVQRARGGWLSVGAARLPRASAGFLSSEERREGRLRGGVGGPGGGLAKKRFRVQRAPTLRSSRQH